MFRINPLPISIVMITILQEGQVIAECATVIVVPDNALVEAGYIQTLSSGQDASSKHEFHAMAQMAYYQYQDDDLPVKVIEGEIEVVSGDNSMKFIAAMVLCRDQTGGFHALIHSGLNAKKMLEAAHRFCTRWIRLDI